jgi:hypothetical protein
MTSTPLWMHHAQIRRLTAGIAVLAAVVAGVGIAPSAQAAPTPASAAPDAVSAQKLARAAGGRVEVMAERTEYAQLFAEPSGRFTYEAAVTPQRVHRADGSWADVDLTLAADRGAIRPKASIANVRFSAGGDGPLVTLVRAGKSFTLSWPLGSLPAPALAGDSATYANVLPDVDLVVRATRLGFTHVLAVKSAAAAADPRIKQISFDLGGTAEMRRGYDGSLAAVSGDNIVALADAPTMWDSAKAPVAAKSAAKTAAAAAEVTSPDPSTAAAVGDTARTAAVGTSLTPDGDLVLKPDPALLASATFPLYIDPAWSTGKSRWAYSTNNNSNNTDTSRARVGKDPSGGVVYRSYFEFPISAIKSKFVYDAYVQTKVDHTYSCTNTPNTIFNTNPISGTPRTAWKSTSWYLKMLAQVSSHANEGTGCSDSPQPDVTINFNTDAVKSVVQAGAKAGSSSITFVISAVDSTVAGESTQDRWKKYFPNDTKLITDVDAIPTKPTEQYVNGVRCGSGTLGIGTTALKFSAKLPDGDSTQSIKATWEWQKLSGSTWSAMTTPATSSAAANTLATSATISGGVTGTTYRMHVKSTDPSPYNQSSPSYSDWCQFKIDTSDPIVGGVVVTLPPGPGKLGTFKIRSADSDVAKFRYGWSAAVTEILPTGTEVENGVTYKYATVNLTAPKYGFNTLFLQAVDTTANVGDGSIPFTVERASPPVARWTLESYPGSVDPLADQQPTLGGSTPLTATGVSYTDAKRMVGGTEATFAGAGTLATTGAVVDTTKSFGVAAWIKVTTLTGYQNFVAQDGAHTTNFQLQYRSDNNALCFTMRNVDEDSTTAATFACATGTPVAGRWMHVAGTFDATEKKMRVWVDGVLKQETAAPTPWASTGPLRIGNRKYTTTSNVDYLTGAVADVQVFDRAIVQEDLTGDATDPADAVEGERGILTPVAVARWGFEDATPCYDPTIPDDTLCEDPDNDTGFGGRLHFTQGVEILPAAAGQIGVFDNKQLLWDDPTDPFYGTSTTEYGLSQRNTGTAAAPVWQDAPVLLTNESFTLGVRANFDNLATTMTVLAAKGVKQSPFYLGTRSSTVNSVTAKRFEVMFPSADQDVGETYGHAIAPDALVDDDAGVWYDLTLVYNAATKQYRLFVNGDLKATATQSTAWNATGPMLAAFAWYTPDNGTPGYTDRFTGGIDDVRIFQGAMTDAQVAALDAAMNTEA